MLIQNRLDRDQDVAQHTPERGGIDIEKHIRLAQSEILEEDLVGPPRHHHLILADDGDVVHQPGVSRRWSAESGVFSISKKHQFRRVMGQAKHIHHNVLGVMEGLYGKAQAQCLEDRRQAAELGVSFGRKRAVELVWV